MCKSVMDSNKLPFMGYDTRIVVSSSLWEASIKDVQARLGHTDIQTTMNIYAHVTREEKKDTADKFAKFMEN